MSALKPAGWFNPYNDYHGYQQVAPEFEGTGDTIPLYQLPPGYVILSPDEVRGIRDEALEEAIKAALDHPGQQFTNHRGHVDWAPTSKYDVAAAIRSLKGGRDAQ